MNAFSPILQSDEEKKLSHLKYQNKLAIIKVINSDRDVVLRVGERFVHQLVASDFRHRPPNAIGNTLSGLNLPDDFTAWVVVNGKEYPCPGFLSVPDFLAGKEAPGEPALAPTPTPTPSEAAPPSVVPADESESDGGRWDQRKFRAMLGPKAPPKPKAEPTPELAPAPATGEGQGDEGDDAGPADQPEVDGDPNTDEAKERAKKFQGDVLRQFNKDHCVVDDNGNVVVFKEVDDRDWGRKRWQSMSFDAFEKAHQNKHIMVYPKSGGDPRAKTYGKFWLLHPNRREYLNGVVFDPSHIGTNQPGVLNLWQGFAVQPKRGSWGKLKDHIRTNICRSDDSHFDYLLGWMARMIQFPHKQGEVAVVLRGDLGTGKGTLGHVLLDLVGRHGMHISSSKHLTGNFNGHLRDCIYLFSDEAFYAGDKAGIGTLKALITEPKIAIEKKHKDAVQATNRLHILMTSNLDWVVPAAQEERRFFVLDISNDRRQDLPYFKAMRAEMDDGGLAAMLFELQNYDVTDFNVRAVPQTKALEDQKKLSWENHILWWYDTLARGFVLKSRLGLDEHFGHWHNVVATDLLFDCYIEFAKSRGDRHPLDRVRFGKFMRKMKAEPARPAGAFIGEHVIGGVAKPTYKPRAAAYSVGTLAQARDAFETERKMRIEWPTEAPEHSYDGEAEN